MDPVSYTHLDVYKRQGMDKLLEAKMPEGWVIVQALATVDATTYDLYMNNMRAMMQEPVSYTHLDVYKRQAVYGVRPN